MTAIFLLKHSFYGITTYSTWAQSSEQMKLIVEAVVCYLENRSFDNTSQQNLSNAGVRPAPGYD